MAVFPYADADHVGDTLYAFVNPNGLTTFANLTTQEFETYNVANWSKYAVTMTETSPGLWFGTWPTWFSDGTYYFSIREQLGGSPASSDGAPIGVGTAEYTAGTSPPPGTLPMAAFELTAAQPENSDLASSTIYLNTGETRIGRMTFRSQGELILCESDTVVSNGTIVSDDITIVSVDDEDNDDYSLSAAFTAEDAGTVTITWSAALSDGDVVIRNSTIIVTDP